MTFLDECDDLVFALAHPEVAKQRAEIARRYNAHDTLVAELTRLRNLEGAVKLWTAIPRGLPDERRAEDAIAAALDELDAWRKEQPHD